MDSIYIVTLRHLFPQLRWAATGSGAHGRGSELAIKITREGPTRYRCSVSIKDQYYVATGETALAVLTTMRGRLLAKAILE